MATDAGPRSDTANAVKVVVGALCIGVALVGLIYVAAPKAVAGVFVHALGAVAQLWPGAH